jgi:hypothetical protein
MRKRRYTKVTRRPVTRRRKQRNPWVELAFGVAAVGAAAFLVRPL